MPCPTPDDAVVPSGAEQDDAASKFCLRCRTQPATTYFRDTHYCQPCALIGISSKAKPGLEFARGASVAKQVRRPSTSAEASSKGAPGHIAVAFSGGINSRVLLSMVRRYFRPRTEDSSSSSRILSQKPPKSGGTSQNETGRFVEVATIFVFYVDCSCLFPPDSKGSIDRTDEIKQLVEQEDCPDIQFVPLKIEEAYAGSSEQASGSAWRWTEAQDQSIATLAQKVENARDAARELFDSISSADVPRTAASSARTRLEDLHRILLHSVLRREAERRNCAALLFGESGTRMSIRLIENLAKGAGHKLAIEISEACWIDDTLVIQPLKSHLAHEVQYFAKAVELDYLRNETPLVPASVAPEQTSAATPFMDKASISRLTESFVTNLDKSAPSTVSTIGRTGSKMVMNGAGMEAPGSTFDVVGPSVSLSSRSAKSVDTLADTMSATTVSGSGSQEPWMGKKTMRLAQSSSACLRWDTAKGCVLCSMPYTKDARFWKRNITISSLSHVEPQHSTVDSSPTRDESWLCLADHLCYACLLVLLPGTNGPTTSLLPPFVLHNLLTKLKSSSNAAEDNESSLQLQANGNDASRIAPVERSVPRKLGAEEMKAEINEFLI